MNQRCPDCSSTVDRRNFLKTSGAALAGVAAAPLLTRVPAVHAAAATETVAETAVQQFYASLSEQQRAAICFPFQHELRQKVSANWHITKPEIGDDFYNDEQRAIINQILRGITSEDGYERLVQQMDEDAAGVEHYSVAVFGDPGRNKFEWIMTGRHLTLRADGDSVDKTAFGGPLVYGHGEENPADNMFYYQTRKTNQVFQALDAKQAAAALVTKAPPENEVPIQGQSGKFPGIAVGELSDDQKQLVEESLKVLLAPYRERDVNEVMEILKAGGGVDSLHMAFYKEGDLESDQVWDIWRVEGPSFVWHFRAAPHVHAYINISLRDS